MYTELNRFTPAKKFLLCVDSDGCAMDTMDVKHIRCFGPCMVEEWGLQAWQDEILPRWNEINLYTITRGINRFKALALALAEVNEKYRPIEGVADLVAWADTAPELSNQSVRLAAAHSRCLAKAYAWSQKVNAGIAALPDDCKNPFAHVREGLAAAHAFADVAVVSSANREAVVEEWQRCGLLDCVDVLCCQDDGSKAHCIDLLKRRGYAADHILMVGDAPGDRQAAAQNGVFFYPILVRRESASWQELCDTALAKFASGTYASYGEEKALEFLRNLGA